MDKKMTRRSFFSTLASVAGTAVIAPTLINTLFTKKAFAQNKRGSTPSTTAELPLVDGNDPVAKAVKYTDDAKKSPESKGNTCATCSFYTKKESRNGKDVGTCTIFAGKVVAGPGWCASWNKKV